MNRHSAMRRPDDDSDPKAGAAHDPDFVTAMYDGRLVEATYWREGCFLKVSSAFGSRRGPRGGLPDRDLAVMFLRDILKSQAFRALD